MILDLLVLLFTALILLFGVSFLLGIFSAGPFIPTASAAVKKFAAVADLKKGQRIFDLGCGDGRLLRYIEREYGLCGQGYEIAPLVYFLARIINSLKRSRVKIRWGSLFAADLSKADVIFLYIVPMVLRRLAVKIRAECRPGTLIVSEAFPLPLLKLEKHYPRAEGIPSFYLYRV